MTEPWLSADAIAEHLGVTKDTVYSWIAEKQMPAHKVGRLWKFQASEVDDWVAAGARSRGRQRLMSDRSFWQQGARADKITGIGS